MAVGVFVCAMSVGHWGISAIHGESRNFQAAECFPGYSLSEILKGKRNESRLNVFSLLGH